MTANPGDYRSVSSTAAREFLLVYVERWQQPVLTFEAHRELLLRGREKP